MGELVEVDARDLAGAEALLEPAEMVGALGEAAGAERGDRLLGEVDLLGGEVVGDHLEEVDGRRLADDDDAAAAAEARRAALGAGGHLERVAPSTRMRVPNCLFADSSRAARLIASPIAV
jgi:hypothetical protein